MSGLHWSQAARGNFPAVHISNRIGSISPLCLVIRTGAGLSTVRKPRIYDAYRRLQEWRITMSPAEADPQVPAPVSADLWKAACGDVSEQEACDWLHERDREQNNVA
jgi:hypothetical protein